MKINIIAIRDQLFKTTQKIEAEMERLTTHRINSELGGNHEAAVWDKAEENLLQEIDNRLYEAVNLIDERTQI